jgi:hypothetical protein
LIRLPAAPFEKVKMELVERLRVRSRELEEMIVAHLRGGSDGVTRGEHDAQFAIGQREAVAACLECWLVALAQGGRWSGPVPPAVDAQARRAVRSDVSLATTLSRYVAAQALAWELVLEEAQGIGGADARLELLRQAWTSTASLLASLVRAVCDAYTAESARYLQTREQRQGQLLRRLLASEPGIDVRGIGYDFSGQHVGLIASGAHAKEGVQALAKQLGCQLLCVDSGDGTVWAWLGGRPRIAAKDVERYLLASPDPALMLTAGRLECGMAGFRLTHKHAKAALRVARLEPRPITWYADVEPVALALQDEELARSMIAAYIAPIAAQRDGASLLKTLRTFYASGRNQAKAGKVLGTDRHTVERHLRRVELLIGSPLQGSHAKVELALRLHELWHGEDADALRVSPNRTN